MIKPCVLIILDGWGENPKREGNAVKLAKTPQLDKLKEEYPHTQLLCSGEAVGLPKGIMGNSEVGHLNIGAGRIVFQDLLKINRAIKDGSFFDNEVFNSAMAAVKENQSTLHLMGLVSDGGVHSSLNHLYSLLDLAKKSGLKHVYVHAILDGRDSPPDSGIKYIKLLSEYMRAHKSGSIATICGRFYAMDRDKRWNRIEKAFQLYVQGKGTLEKNPIDAVKNSYFRGETDEFIQPIILTGPTGKPLRTVQNDDVIIFFNFRADRAREITRAFTDPTFEAFDRMTYPKLAQFVCMTSYDETFTLPIAFPPTHLNAILGQVISQRGLRQLRIAETEKYAHVTYFFNGGEEKPFPLEDRCLIPSPRDIPTYDLKPEMSAYQLTQEVITRLKSNQYDLIVLNFANMDMVGHTGVLHAAIKACETVDHCVGEIVSVVKALNGVVLITADHGNAEQMVEEDGHIHTAHTLNPVPFILVDDSRKEAEIRSGILADIAPTVLRILGIDKPQQMTGDSLVAS
ncbi:MAG: 2,3-bisphosphoglycerate-independent phosphoglycerate mutase [Desulfobacterales bacterium]|nr:2,3-bisphosphoglycerate-independent phosphoglycerate mutase [Desulfobacterales bacterium]